MMNPILTAAIHFRDAGISTIATERDGTKRPAECVGEWKPYQDRPPTQRELERWHRGGTCGLAVVTGAVSGGLEIIDFDEPELLGRWRESLARIDPGLFGRLSWETTPSGGSHLIYRCPERSGSRKLAMRPELPPETETRIAAMRRRGQPVTDAHRRPKPVTMIETRGEGGYTVTSPTPGYRLRQGDRCTLPMVTPEEREIMHRVARSFNECLHEPHRTHASRPARPLRDGELRPGDDYNRRGDVLDLLERHGWRIEAEANGEVRLTRPGKDGGTSATWGHYPGCLIVFSTNAAPFEATSADEPRGYDGFAVYALLEHDGDFTAAAKALYRAGYGTRRGPTLPRAGTSRSILARRPSTVVAVRTITLAPRAINVSTD